MFPISEFNLSWTYYENFEIATLYNSEKSGLSQFPRKNTHTTLSVMRNPN